MQLFAAMALAENDGTSPLNLIDSIWRNMRVSMTWTAKHAIISEFGLRRNDLESN